MITNRELKTIRDTVETPPPSPPWEYVKDSVGDLKALAYRNYCVEYNHRVYVSGFNTVKG